MTLRTIIEAYLRFREGFRARLTRSMHAAFMRRRAKSRAFLAMPVDAKVPKDDRIWSQKQVDQSQPRF